jgi:hypothetical protein
MDLHESVLVGVRVDRAEPQRIFRQKVALEKTLQALRPSPLLAAAKVVYEKNEGKSKGGQLMK